MSEDNQNYGKPMPHENSLEERMRDNPEYARFLKHMDLSDSIGLKMMDAIYVLPIDDGWSEPSSVNIAKACAQIAREEMKREIGEFAEWVAMSNIKFHNEGYWMEGNGNPIGDSTSLATLYTNQK